MDTDEARTIGRRLRRLRDARGKSLRVVAGLAGMSTSHLWRIEHGERALDLSELVALAGVLEIAPSELIRLPVPAPANGHTDSAVQAVFLALMAASRDRPGGQVLPVQALRARVTATVDALPLRPQRRGRHCAARVDPGPAHQYRSGPGCRGAA